MRKDPVLSAQLNSIKSTLPLSTSCDFLRHCPLLQCPSPFFHPPLMSTPAILVNPYRTLPKFSPPILLKFYESPAKTTFFVTLLAAKTGENITLPTGGRSTDNTAVVVGLLTSGDRERCRSPWLQKTHPLSSRQSATPPCHLCTAASSSPPSRHRTK